MLKLEFLDCLKFGLLYENYSNAWFLFGLFDLNLNSSDQI